MSNLSKPNESGKNTCFYFSLTHMKHCYKTLGHSKLKWGTQGVDHAINSSFDIYL